MEKNSYYNNDICIVGIGCVLPDANNPREFWNNILEGNCSIKEMPEERFKKRLYFSDNKNEKDKTYSNTAAFVEDNQLKKICENLGLDFLKNTRIQIMSLGAARQALACLNPGSLEKSKNKTSVYLGCMELDEALLLEKIFLHNKKLFKEYIEKNGLKDGKRIFEAIKKHFNGGKKMDKDTQIASTLTSSTVNFIKKRFNIKGEGALVDAACASSLAALDAAINSLKNREADMAITGGAESNLGPETFVLFSKVGALSAGKCLPFDKRTDGLSQGEGAAIFILQRIEDALRDKNKIYGVIKSIGGSSDGRSASLFSPSSKGQVLAYERAYEGLDKNGVDYIECHGTGTQIGDVTEIKSLNEFFKTGKIPVGSVKSLVGHIKGAAGAAGLLKCILMMKNKVIPPSKYIESSLAPQDGAVYLNTKAIPILPKEKPLRFGVSSSGFGNINYHLVLDEFKDSIEIIKSERNKPVEADKIVVIGSGFAPSGKIDPSSFALKFKIPPQSIPFIDRVQLLALASASDAFEKSNIEIDSLNKEKVSVISASSLGLDFALNFTERVRYFEFEDALGFLNKKDQGIMINIKNRFPEVTEDTGHGILNNVIAGRICNTFDFKGKNFNVDSDFNSFLAALNIAARELKEHPGIVVLIFCDEKINEDKTRVLRTNVSCLLLSTLALAKKKNYPIQKLIKKINYYE